MPFIPHTPESLLRRSDSRNPATTCKGITTLGTHCRRSIASSPSSASFIPHRRPKTTRDGVLAVLEPSDGTNNEGAAAFFCWQHKAQAITLTNATHDERKTNLVYLKERTSVDTLVERLGLLDPNDHGEGESRKESRKQWTKQKPAPKDTLPKQWQHVDGPLLAVYGRRGEKNPQRGRRKEPGFFATLCCIGSSDVEPLPPSRVHKDDEKLSKMKSVTMRVPPQTHPSQRAMRDTSPMQQQTRATQELMSPERARHSASTPPAMTRRPKPNRESSSQTQRLLSLIPPTLSPQTASLILAELAKAVSPHDEAGYIYIFWLTPPSASRPDDETASLLLTDDKTSPAMPHGRKKSEIIAAHAAYDKSQTLLLKIGRAANVQRRMNQWTRQCGYELSLVRFYPYLPSPNQAPSPLPSPSHGKSPSSPSPEEGPLKVPHAQKVERLIHLELADRRVKQSCEACGKEHKEWFEVRGTREELRGVDGVVKKWVGWATREI